jgi:hypothetical protein
MNKEPIQPGELSAANAECAPAISRQTADIAAQVCGCPSAAASFF